MRQNKTGTDNGTVTITASSVEELLQKIQDYMQLAKSDTVLTDAEKKVGQNIDFLRLGAAYGSRDNSKHGGAVGYAEPVAEKEK